MLDLLYPKLCKNFRQQNLLCIFNMYRFNNLRLKYFKYFYRLIWNRFGLMLNLIPIKCDNILLRIYPFKIFVNNFFYFFILFKKKTRQKVFSPREKQHISICGWVSCPRPSSVTTKTTLAIGTEQEINAADGCVPLNASPPPTTWWIASAVFLCCSATWHTRKDLRLKCKLGCWVSLSKAARL